MCKCKSLTELMIEEWAATTPGVVRIEGVLDTPEKIQAYVERMDEAMKKYPRPGLLPRR